MGITKVSIDIGFIHGSKANQGSKTKAKNSLVKVSKLYKGQTPNVEEGY